MTDHAPSALPPFEPPIEGAPEWITMFTAAFEGGSYASVARLAAVIAPDYVGVQSGAPDAVGPEGFLDLFQRVYALLPDLVGRVVASHTDDDTTFLEVELTGTLAGRRVSWAVCDRFTRREGLVVARVSYYDPTPLLLAILRPQAWRTWWRSGVGAPRRPIAPKVRRALIESTGS